MWFLTTEDWFGRPGPYDFDLPKIIFIVLSILACIYIPLLLKRKSAATVRKTLLFLWIFNVVIDLIKYICFGIYALLMGEKITDYDLPLWLCSIYLYVMPISLFSKNEKRKGYVDAFLCSLSIFGGVINFFFPKGSVFSFEGLHSFLYHFVVMLAPIIMLVTGYYKPKVKHVYGAFVLVTIFAIPVNIFNYIYSTDYMFLYDGRWFGPVYSLAQLMPHKLVWSLVCMALFFAVMWFVLLLEEKLTRPRKT